MKDQTRKAVFAILEKIEQLSRGGGLLTSSPPASQVRPSQPGLGGVSPAQTMVDHEAIVRLRQDTRKELLDLRSDLSQHFSERECYLALFPIVVCIDELVQTRFANVDQSSWPLLQREFFKVDQGGELFYTTIDEGLERDIYPSLIYEIFYFCLSAGFRGKYSGDERTVARYLDTLAARLPTEVAEATRIEESPPGRIKPTASHWWFYVGAVVVLLLVYVLLRGLAGDEPATGPSAPSAKTTSAASEGS